MANEEHENCGLCGGEKDAEGWCANYCMDDGPSDECCMCSDAGVVPCNTCGGRSAFGDACSANCNNGKIVCPVCGGFSALSETPPASS